MNVDTCNKMNEYLDNYTELKKKKTKRVHASRFYLYKILKNAN